MGFRHGEGELVAFVCRRGAVFALWQGTAEDEFEDAVSTGNIHFFGRRRMIDVLLAGAGTFVGALFEMMEGLSGGCVAGVVDGDGRGTVGHDSEFCCSLFADSCGKRLIWLKYTISD